MKILIIRFSSIGDLTQSLSIPALIKHYEPNAEIHFVTRKDLSPLVENHPLIKKTWTLDREKGFSGLLELCKELKKENFTHIYDAHNNLRSATIRFLVSAQHKLVRPMMRFKRFLLIRFQINLFEKPFSGQRDLLKPLEKWGYPFFLPPPVQLFLDQQSIQQAENILKTNQNFVVLAPSAAYFLKRWPLEKWHELIKKNEQTQFVILAGKEDLFTEALNIYKNVINLTGKTNLLQSAAVVSKAAAVVSNDTGLLHFAEQLGKKSVALMGPAPFGFPSRSSTIILERNLKCRPCSKHGQGPCKNKFFHECMVTITSDEVTQAMKSQL